MRLNGKLIVIEGLDGSGKATQAKILTDWIQAQGKKAMLVSFPDYDSPSSGPVKIYLSGEMGEAMQVNPFAASTFYAVDRYISYQKNWKDKYIDGHTIIADRYTTSNAAYQMCKLPQEQWNDYLRWLEDYEYDRMKLPRPSIVIYLDVKPETSRKLLEKRYNGDESLKDIHEKDIRYLQKCRKAALYAAMRLGWQVVCCDKDDEILPIEVIAQKLKQKVTKGL